MTFHSLLTALDEWSFRKAPPHLMAILRIGLGLFLLFYWGLKAPHIGALFSDQGLWLTWPDATWSLPFQLISSAPPVAVAWLIYGTFMLCLLAITIGFVMRPAALIAVILYGYYWLISLHLFPTSYDRLFPFLLLVIAFSGADAAFSLRMGLRYGSVWAWEYCSVLPQRIIALQVAATYLGVGWQKMVLPAWQNGDVLSQSLMGMWGTPAAHWLLRQNLPAAFYDRLTELTMAMEFWLPFGLWIPRWQWLFFAMGATFHILVAVLLGIWWFLILIPAYIVFLSPEDVFQTCRRFLTQIPDHPGALAHHPPRHFGLGRHRRQQER